MKLRKKYFVIDTENPDAVARCDRSGMVVNHKDLIKQMEYRGSGLVWTGYWVGRMFAATPNIQLQTPLVYGDPYPVDNARPWQTPSTPWMNQIDSKWDNEDQSQYAGWGVSNTGNIDGDE